LDAFVAQIEDEQLRRLYLYWDEKRAGRKFPARRDIDPLELGFVLGWVLLLDVEYNPLRFRFRIYGSALAARVDYDMTGKYADEHPNETVRQHIEAAWRDVVTRATPVHAWMEDGRGPAQHQFETLRLPLSSDGAVIDMLLVGVRPRKIKA
jgi:hypothetical protein